MDTNTNATPQPVVAAPVQPAAVQPVTTQNMTVAPKKGGNPVLKLACLGCVVLVLIGVVAGGGFVYFNYFAPKAKYNVTTGAEELNLVTKDSVTQAIKAVDFSKLNKENPADILNTPELFKLSKQNERLNKLAANSTLNGSGKTVEFAISTKFDVSTDPTAADTYSTTTATDNSGELNADVFVANPTYDAAKYTFKTQEDMKKFVDNLTVEELDSLMPKIKLLGDLDLNVQGENIKGKLEFYFLDKTIYIKFYDVTIPASADTSLKNQLKLIEDKMIKIDLSKYYDTYLQQVIDLLKKSYDQQTVLTEKDLYDAANKALKDLLKNAKQEDIDLIKKVGNQVMQVVVDEVNKTDVLTSIKTVSPLKSDADSECSQGTLNAKGILDSFSDGAKKIFDILEKEGKTTQTKDKFTKTVDQTVSAAKDELDAADFNMNLRTCYNNKLSTLSGVGFDVKYRTSSYYVDSGYNFSVDYLVVNYDSKEKVEAPTEDLDFTENFNTLMDSSKKSLTTTVPTTNYEDLLNDYTPDSFDSTDYLP